MTSSFIVLILPILVCAYGTFAISILNDEKDVVLLTGGWPYRKSVEVFGLPWCHPRMTLPDPLGRYSHTSHYVNGKVLICGGMYTSNTTLELIDGEFRPSSHLNVHRHGHSGLVLRNQLSLLGGDRSPTSMETLIGNTWLLQKSMSHSVLDSCVVAFDNSAMVIGGVGNPSSVSVYDGRGGRGRWQEKRSLPNRRYGHGCVALRGGRVLVAGGSDGESFLNTAVMITNKGDSYEELPGRMNIARGWGQLVKLNGRILYFGGVDKNYRDLSSIEEFEESTGTWKMLEETMKNPRGYLSAVVVPASVVGC